MKKRNSFRVICVRKSSQLLFFTRGELKKIRKSSWKDVNIINRTFFKKKKKNLNENFFLHCENRNAKEKADLTAKEVTFLVVYVHMKCYISLFIICVIGCGAIFEFHCRKVCFQTEHVKCGLSTCSPTDVHRLSSSLTWTRATADRKMSKNGRDVKGGRSGYWELNFWCKLMLTPRRGNEIRLGPLRCYIQVTYVCASHPRNHSACRNPFTFFVVLYKKVS